MLHKLSLVLISSITLITLHGQNPSLKFGDYAPKLQVKEWIKGTPIQSFEKGKVYVLEFWATWCPLNRHLILDCKFYEQIRF